MLKNLLLVRAMVLAYLSSCAPRPVHHLDLLVSTNDEAADTGVLACLVSDCDLPRYPP